MCAANFTLSAIGDEVADDLHTQLRVLRDLQIGHLELRRAWGKNVLHLDDEEVARVREMCDGQGVAVSCVGSPIGKSPITDPIGREISNLSRACQIGEALNTRLIRVFSFYPPDTSSSALYDGYVPESAIRLSQLSDLAQQRGFLLVLENEKAIVGDTPERCSAILRTVNSPHLRFAWDPANFVRVGVSHPTDSGWPLLGSYVAHVHVKDSTLADGTVRAAGEGDGQIQELLAKLQESDYQGFLSLEPHLAIAGHSSGFSGPRGMTYAAKALRRLLAETTDR
jgi:sugar phosphate isomerase/epimerase